MMTACDVQHNNCIANYYLYPVCVANVIKREDISIDGYIYSASYSSHKK